MKQLRASVVAALAISIAMPAAVSRVRADDTASPDAQSLPAIRDSSDSGQTLEIPPVQPPVAAAPSPVPAPGADANSSDTWSDGTHTYMWQNQNADEAGNQQPPDNSTQQPSYAGVNDYMNQQMQTEAMGPAFSPFYGPPTFLINPYGFYGYNSYYYTPGPGPVAQPPPRAPRPPPRTGPPGGGHHGFPHPRH